MGIRDTKKALDSSSVSEESDLAMTSLSEEEDSYDAPKTIMNQISAA
ncbi:hypothetical protein [Streptacidiphilus neutrinimicus]|nr:hypothetical protein [Streptacidiphilus neutrinimicus]